MRAVVKRDGVHAARAGSTRDWLPFSLRLYFHAGADNVRIIHSFIDDGDPARDFIGGLGVTARVAMNDASHDRHVRFAGERERCSSFARTRRSTISPAPAACGWTR